MMTTPTTTTGIWTIVVAAGQGRRFGGDVPKQFTEVAGCRIVDHSARAAAAVSEGVVVVMPPDGEHALPETPGAARATMVAGGATRSESVRCGLAAIDRAAAGAEIVLVHDAARPLASPQLFTQVIEAVRAGADAVVPVVPVVDTLRHIDGRSVDRSQLVAVQTPQGFSIAALRLAHRHGAEATDDATLVTEVGGRLATVPGERWNLKVTDPGDELIAEALLRGRAGRTESDARHYAK